MIRPMGQGNRDKIVDGWIRQDSYPLQCTQLCNLALGLQKFFSQY
jgi:hypothetical protein